MRIDDSLDVFAVHGAGGVLGIILVSFLADTRFGGVGYADGMDSVSHLSVQGIGIAAVLAWSVIASMIIILIVKSTTGLRVDPTVEEEGFHISTHGETNYRQ